MVRRKQRRITIRHSERAMDVDGSPTLVSTVRFPGSSATPPSILPGAEILRNFNVIPSYVVINAQKRNVLVSVDRSQHFTNLR